MKETLLNNLNQIRSILNFENDLEIISLENHYQISIKLNSNLQLKCLIHQSIDFLTIENLDDLRLYQLTNTNLFESIRNYFFHLIQQSNSSTSLFLIIQLIQEYYFLLLLLSKNKQHSTFLPEQCLFLTWNIGSELYSIERYEHICKLFESSLPDLICLYEVTNTFFQLLSNQKWLKKHRYSMIMTENCLTNQSNEQIMLMKNFRPESYEIGSIDSSKSNQYIHACFRLTNKTTIDIIHFHGKSLENLLNKINSKNFLLIGDFDIEDDYLIDLCKDMYDLDENSNSTFDRKRTSQIRYFLHKLSNLSYTIDDENSQIQDHFGLQLSIHFRVRYITDQYRLMIKSNEWIELFKPFFQLKDTEDDQEDLLLPLRFLFTQYEHFDIKIIDKLQQLFSNSIEKNQSNQFCNNLVKLESIRYIYIIKQQIIDNHHRISFDITHQIPIGCIIEPIRYDSCEYIDNDLREFFSRMNLYSNEKIFRQKQEKYQRLVVFFEKNFGENFLHSFRYVYLPYGSFRLGLNGDDLDTVFVLYENQLINKTSSKLDQLFDRLKFDLLSLINYLQQRIFDYFADDLIECRKIEALYPIISIVFNDQTKVEIFVQIILNKQMNIHQTLHGIHDLERLIVYVRYPILFQYFLTFIRTWAQNIGIYGQVYGYLGGYSLAILCAYICRNSFPKTFSSFSLKEFSILIEQFFSIYSNFDWSSKSICLYLNHISDDYRGSMRILCPTKPYNNTSRSTINSTRYLIIQAFRNVRMKSLEEILQLSSIFPDKKLRSILQLTLSTQTNIELNQWIGYMKSRLAHFLVDCENNCNLFVQTDTKVIVGKHSLERFYFLGFDQNEQILSRHREFYLSLNRFFDQFKIYSSRTVTMQISYKLMSIHDFFKLNC